MRLTELAHRLLAEALGPGGRAVDATAGNGHDTLFLARRAGPTGRVLALDIQPAAVATTRARLDAAGHGPACEVREADHARLAEWLPADFRGATDAVVLNLGYLPGSDHALVTRPEGTVAALRAGLAALRPGGRLVVVAYTGHPGGEAEAEAVAAFGAACRAEGHDAREHGREPGSGKPWVLCVTRSA